MASKIPNYKAGESINFTTDPTTNVTTISSVSTQASVELGQNSGLTLYSSAKNENGTTIYKLGTKVDGTPILNDNGTLKANFTDSNVHVVSGDQNALTVTNTTANLS